VAADDWLIKFKRDAKHGEMFRPLVHFKYSIPACPGWFFIEFLSPNWATDIVVKKIFAAFQKARGYEKCALPAGVGARLAAAVMMAGDGPARS